MQSRIAIVVRRAAAGRLRSCGACSFWRLSAVGSCSTCSNNAFGICESWARARQQTQEQQSTSLKHHTPPALQYSYETSMMTSPRPLSRIQAHCNSSMPRGFAGTLDVRLALGELPINVASKRTFTGAKLYGDHAVCKRSKTEDDEIPSEPVPAIDGREETLLDTLDDSSTTRSLTPPPLQLTPDNIDGLLITRPTDSIPLHYCLPEVEAHVKTLKVRLGMAMFKLRKHKADVHYRAVVAARLPQLATIGARTKQPKHWGAISCGLGERREHDNRGSQWTNFSESPQLTNDNAQV